MTLWFLFAPQADLLRIDQFGAMVVRQTKEYHKSGSDQNVGEGLNVNHLFVGGVTGVVNTSVLEVKHKNISCNNKQFASYYFTCCINTKCWFAHVHQIYLAFYRIPRHRVSLAVFVKLRFKPSPSTRNSI
jgi:hypothetical protein